MIEKQVEEFYDHTSSQYDDIRFSRPYYRKVAEAEHRYILENIHASGSVLEIGPGTGRFTTHLVQKASRVTAIDISQNMLDHLQQRVPADNLSTYKLSVYQLANLPEYGKFDTVVCMRVLPHLEDPLQALNLMAQAVGDGGNIIFDLWNLNSFVGLVRWLFRRPLQVFTRFYSYAEMLKIIDQSGLQIKSSTAWGYPRIGTVSLDYWGNLFLKPLGYSIIFNVQRK